jgi:hypothetical protein
MSTAQSSAVSASSPAAQPFLSVSDEGIPSSESSSQHSAPGSTELVEIGTQHSCSPAKFAANRKNSRKSTGPKTPAGKSRSSRNSTTLGLYSSHNVLPCEDPALFLELRSAYLADLHPQTPIELLLVEQIISAAWKIRRLHAAEYQLHLIEHGHLHAAFEDAQQTYQQSKERYDRRAQLLGPQNVPPPPKPPLPLNDTPIPPGTTLANMLSRPDGCALDRLHLHEQRLQRSIHRALTQLRTLRKSRPDSHDLPQHPYLDEETRAHLLSPQPQSPTQHQNKQNEPKNKQNEPTASPSPADGGPRTRCSPALVASDLQIKPTHSTFRPLVEIHPSD